METTAIRLYRDAEPDTLQYFIAVSPFGKDREDQFLARIKQIQKLGSIYPLTRWAMLHPVARNHDELRADSTGRGAVLHDLKVRPQGSGQEQKYPDVTEDRSIHANMHL